MFRLSTIVALATVAVLKATLGVDPANSSEGTRGCDADIRDTRNKKAGQPDLMLTIDNFTATPSEDREMLLAICERASATEASAEEAMEALRRVFIYGEPPQQLSAARLWAYMLLYSPARFLRQCAKIKFLNTLEDVLNSQSTLRVVRERLLDVLAGAVAASSTTSYQDVSGLGVLWRRVKSAREPNEGVPFWYDDAMIYLLSRRNPENISSAMHLQQGSIEEDHTPSTHRTVRTELASSVQHLVECCICMDEMPVGSTVHIDSCGHTFCRKCLNGHVAARLDEPSFPIHCPACTAAKGKGKGKASVISQFPGLNLGLAEGYPPSVKPQSLRATAESDMDSMLYAMRLQHEFDDEDRALSMQRTELVNFAERLFECSICMDDVPMDSIAHIDSCGHTFCRECLRGHVAACLEEHKFPVRCPTCTANKGKGHTGEVSQSLALELGLTDEQFNIWTEMEMVAFSILLNCRKCQRSMFVARDEHDDVSVIACPLPDCDHIWCKLCQQSIDLNGPAHSCDGTSELDHLVKEQGWKYCPTCKTPIQKTSGCNHMTCITPACNTHFCYRCGDLIVKSALSQEIEEATSSHYRRTCSLFEVPE